MLVIAQDTTSYGWDLLPKSSLHELMELLDKVDGIDWIRLHYAHPAHLNKKMIEQYSKLEKLLPYIDMPTQHGSDNMLKNMKRGLDSNGIKKRIDLLRSANSKIAIRTSIIVGFPGETDKDFNELINFVKDVQFDRLGVFKYSEEEGTSAAIDYIDDVPKEVKQERYDELMLLQQNINFEKNKNRVGDIEKVIIDVSNKDSGFSLGRSYRDAPEIDNYVKINGVLNVGSFYEIKVKEAYEYDVLGEIYEK